MFFFKALLEIKDRIGLSTSKMSVNIIDQFEAEEEKFVLKKINTDGSPDMRYKENREHFLGKNKNKDGSFDMRKLINRKNMGLFKD